MLASAMDVSNHLTTAEVAEKAGVSINTVLLRAKLLNLSPYVRGIAFWSPEQVTQLIQPRKPGRRPKEKRSEQ